VIDHFERRLRANGFGLVAGVDEVGRGALAGPLVAAAVILPESFTCDGLKDSKALAAAERERWDERIRAEAIAVAVVKAYPSRIDRHGLHVTNLALLRRAALALPVRPDYLLCDGLRLRTLGIPHLSMRKGDATCASVAAASIVAKVARDAMMDRYHRRYPAYGFDRHRGYGTPAHRAAIAAHGPCPIHRMSFKGMALYASDRAAYERLYGVVRSGGRAERRRARGRRLRGRVGGRSVSDEDIERFEDDMELRLWREYRDVLPMFAYVVETERRFYLANQVNVVEHEGPGGPWFQVELGDAWVWDMYRPARFVTSVRVITTSDVNIEELAHKEIAPADAMGAGGPDDDLSIG
jgi:ribonuclease HII